MVHGCDVEVLTSPWDDRLVHLARSARGSADICAPFVNRGGTNLLLGGLVSHARVRLLSNFSTAHFCAGYSETAAFRHVLARGGEIRNCQRLHAKVYIFDSAYAVVTSANLTNGGLRGNLECGVLLSSPEVVRTVAETFNHLWDDESVGDIEAEILDDIDALVKALPAHAVRTKSVGPSEAEVVEEPEFVLEGVEGEIAASLTGWKQAVFEALCDIEGEDFELPEVYEYAPELGKLYPDNTEVHAKIRQQLQFLRSLGLVRFLGGGRYRKLWRQ